MSKSPSTLSNGAAPSTGSRAAVAAPPSAPGAGGSTRAAGASSSRRVLAIVVVVVLVGAAFAAGLALNHRSSSSDKPAAASAGSVARTGASASSSSTATTAAPVGSGGQASTGNPTGGSNSSTGIRYTGGQVTNQKVTQPYAYTATNAQSATGTVPPQTLPSVVSVSATQNLTDGQVLSVHAAPTSGSSMFGFEARLCAPGATFSVEYDFYPTQTGNCISAPLSHDSDAHAQVKANPPYTGADLTFRVGEGTNSYTDVDGKHVSITCGPGHPCQLVLLIQVPYGFGFQTFPLTYAS